MSLLFPLLNCSGIPLDPHPGAFAYSRRGKKHTGIDLYTNDGEPVLACEDGEVVCIEHFTGEWDNSPWWNNTDCVLVRGEIGVICYGEVSVKSGLKVGDKVSRGDLIAKVKRVIKKGRERPEITGWSPAMLHTELYPHNIIKPSEGFEDHLQDPTPFLLKANNGKFPIVKYGSYKPKDYNE